MTILLVGTILTYTIYLLVEMVDPLEFTWKERKSIVRVNSLGNNGIISLKDANILPMVDAYD